MKRTLSNIDLQSSNGTVVSRKTSDKPRLTNDDFTVGWICALDTELAASQAMLDEIHPDLPLEPGDNNIYTLGRMGQHNIAIVCLPEGKTGTSVAATAANDLLRSFHKIRFGLMVGVGGGAPSLPDEDDDVRLGDVVVSTPQGGHGGVIQYDFGKTVEGSFVQTGALSKPHSVLRAGVSKIKANHMRGSQKMISYISAVLEMNPDMKTEFAYPGEKYDQLFDADYDHVKVNETSGCDGCDPARILGRQSRMVDDPVIHYGLIGSANQAMRHGLTRENLRQQSKILCFETEAAGLMESFPCIVIRGICHYSDTHESRRWQPYAALTAAGYAKELLSCIPSVTVKSTAEAAKVMSMVRAELVPIYEKFNTLLDYMAREKVRKVLDWLAPPSYEALYVDALQKRQEGTGQWFLDSSQFAAWVGGENRSLLCPGISGAGKTILASIVVHRLRADSHKNVAFLFCNYRRQEEQTPEALVSMLLRQLAEQGATGHGLVLNLYSVHCPKNTRPTIEEMRGAIRYLSEKSQTFVIIDALDECLEQTRTFLIQQIQYLQKLTGISFMITTRPNPGLEQTFQPHGQLEIRANEADIMTYVGGQLSYFSECVQRSLKLQEFIKRKIADHSDGMFLLASLYTKSLRSKRTEGHIEDALQSLSRDKKSVLQTIYRIETERIERQSEDDQGWARRVLAWVIHAKRPLRLPELQHALAIRMGLNELQKKYLPSLSELVLLCAGLVSIDQKSNHVRFAHYTALQYFENDDELPDWVHTAPAEISRTCLTYLALDVFAAGRAPSDQMFEQRMKENVFLDYAARYWGCHARGSQSEIESVAGRFFQNVTLVNCASQVIFAGIGDQEEGYSQLTPQMTGIHLAAWFGLDFLMSKLLLADPQRAKLPDSYDRTPLHLASLRGYEKTVQLLLRHDVDINARDKNGKTALQEASETGHSAVVQILLKHKADASVK